MNNLGNQAVVNQLASLAHQSRLSGLNLSGSYIFSGPSAVGKKQTAMYWAQGLLCLSSRDGHPCLQCASCHQLAIGNHPNLVTLDREEDSKLVGIEPTRDFISHLNRSVDSDSYCFGLINEASLLNEASANALLKTLEEPSRRAIIVLLADNLEALPKTVVSRSQVFRLRPASSKVLSEYLLEKSFERSAIHEAVAISGGRPALALDWLNNDKLRQSQLARLDYLLQIADQPLSDRLSALDKLKYGADSQSATETIDSWKIIARDWLLVSAQADDLVVYRRGLDSYNALVSRLGRQRILNFNRALVEADWQLKANVSPKAVLENLVINL